MDDIRLTACFDKELTKSYVEKDDFILPTDILEFLPESDKDAIVRYDDHEYNMKYKVGVYTRLAQGWKAFIDATGLGIGDVLCFKACLDENRIVFFVHVKEDPEIVMID
ncbi:uncharacterized protein LOC132621462 [Lycium barbarum]|uniref:uncharacterized protein LOC132621462 n=1 Tax=Lycium barbarum TaxID=112863 RepID=UPI00293F5FB9|nr:uncharacterized protein LOC132621462 [Lycium barbarum]